MTTPFDQSRDPEAIPDQAPPTPDAAPDWTRSEPPQPLVAPGARSVSDGSPTSVLPAPDETSPEAPAAPAYPPPSAGSVAHGPPPPRSTRRGPSWPGVILVALLAAALAGLGGGAAGAWLVSRDAPAPRERVAPTVETGSTDRPAGSIASISAQALPSVVTIYVDGTGGQGTGSGWAYDDAGHIVTNNHVIDSAAAGGSIELQLSDGSRTEATLVGRDSSYDVAVLSAPGIGLTPLPIGSSEDVVVGDPVIAMGSPLGLDSTVTSGIVSAVNRPVSPGGGQSQSFINAIQTDAAINPGNSGGPLLDRQGRVIGMNSAIAQASSSGLGPGGNIGVGFAIPSDQVAKTVEQLIATGTAEHPIIGVLLDRSYSGEGVRIATESSGDFAPITPDGPASNAGLEPGDVIIAFEGRPMTDPDVLVVAIRARDVGDEVSLRVRRGDEEFDVTMTLQGRSAD